MKKIVELFKYGIGMYANSLYGDINCKHKEEDLNKDFHRGKRKQRKKSVQSYSHLRVIK